MLNVTFAVPVLRLAKERRWISVCQWILVCVRLFCPSVWDGWMTCAECAKLPVRARQYFLINRINLLLMTQNVMAAGNANLFVIMVILTCL